MLGSRNSREQQVNTHQGLNLGPHQTVVALYQLSYQVLAVSTTAKPYIPLTIQDNQCPLKGLCQPPHFTL